MRTCSPIELVLLAPLLACADEEPTEPLCPLPASPHPKVVQLEGNGTAVMALRSDGSVLCWGYDEWGSCGPSVYPMYSPPAVSRSLACLSQMSLTEGDSAGLQGLGDAVVWSGSLTEYARPFPLSDHLAGLGSVTRVVAGGGIVLTIHERGEVYASGEWQLEDAPSRDVVGLRLPFGGPVKDVAAEGGICGLLESGVVECLGRNFEGMFGVGEVEWVESPITVPLPGEAVAIALRSGVMCVALAGAGTWCSGAAFTGALGREPVGVDDRSVEPTEVQGVPAFNRLKTDGKTVCGLSGTELWCWGEAAGGKLVDPETGLLPESGRLPPMAIPGATDVVDFALADYVLCVLKSDDSVWCRGLSEGEEHCEEFPYWGKVQTEPCPEPIGGSAP